MIHRFHWTEQGEILETFKDYPGPFEFSFKYSVAHMYSITNPPFIQPLLEGFAPGRKTWLTVRHFMDGISMPGANVLCIRDWRTRLIAR